MSLDNIRDAHLVNGCDILVQVDKLPESHERPKSSNSRFTNASHADEHRDVPHPSIDPRGPRDGHSKTPLDNIPEVREGLLGTSGVLDEDARMNTAQHCHRHSHAVVIECFNRGWLWNKKGHTSHRQSIGLLIHSIATPTEIECHSCYSIALLHSLVGDAGDHSVSSHCEQDRSG